ncbi:MAG: GEVED domain-containing protein [Flavobacteriaceae bacterium]|nr:GEVED domain-containing protein [Flavobacteriaceae bacterium]
MKNLFPFLLIFTLFATAQVTNEGQPLSWSYSVDELEVVDTKTLPTFDLKSIQEEDKVNDYSFDKPWRFGYMHSVDYGFEDGKWDVLENGDRIWRILISSPEALSLNFIFDNLFIPKGGSLYLYNSDKSDLLGAYTHKQNQEGGILGTWLVEGESVWIEYYEPQNVTGQGTLHIAKATHGYRNANTFNQSKGLNDSGDCNLDVDCSIGDDWEELKEHNKRSAGILLSGGSGFCSGALINNTENDGTPYFLTANHCYSDPSSWAFRFGWISPNSVCATTANSSNGPTNMTISGATLKARDEGSDFALVQINSDIPEDWDRVFAGWDKSDNFPEFQVSIHHPSGDVMKVCRDDDPATKEINAGAQTWEIVGGSLGGWEIGVTEPGSSGSPLFDQNGRIIGQLFGGGAACAGTNDNGALDYYGRVGVSWEGAGTPLTRLRDWLDPQNSGNDTMDPYPTLTSFPYDSGVSSIDSPNSGALTSTEVVTVTITNFGENSISNFDVSYQLDSGAVITETYTETIATGEDAQYTFSATADMSSVGTTYQIYSYTSLSTDEDSENDGVYKDVTHLNPNDLGISEITSPASGTNLSANEQVTIEITNYGSASQSNFEVSYELNGITVTETVPGPLTGNSSLDYIFSQSLDLSAFGSYEIVASVYLENDSDDSNNTISVTVNNVNCAPTGDNSFGDGFQLFQVGDINNTSAGDGYSDFTDLSTALEQGSTNDLTVTTGYGNQYVRVWIDFNDDFVFSLDELVVDNYVISVGGAAGTWTETMQLVVPDDGTLGEHIMRAKTNWNAPVPDDACEETQYGETEDYMVNIVESLGFSNIQIDNISVYPNPVSNLLNVNTGTNNDLSYSIFNIMGQSISNGKLTTIDNRIDFSQLSKGVYFFNIYNRELNKQNTYKLIKE